MIQTNCLKLSVFNEVSLRKSYYERLEEINKNRLFQLCDNIGITYGDLEKILWKTYSCQGCNPRNSDLIESNLIN